MVQDSLPEYSLGIGLGKDVSLCEFSLSNGEKSVNEKRRLGRFFVELHLKSVHIAHCRFSKRRKYTSKERGYFTRQCVYAMLKQNREAGNSLLFDK